MAQSCDLFILPKLASCCAKMAHAAPCLEAVPEVSSGSRNKCSPTQGRAGLDSVAIAAAEPTLFLDERHLCPHPVSSPRFLFQNIHENNY